MKWISVKDRLPETEGEHLVYDRARDQVRPSLFWFGEWRDVDASTYELDRITHWMPFPEPPKDIDDQIKAAESELLQEYERLLEDFKYGYTPDHEDILKYEKTLKNAKKSLTKTNNK